MTYGPTPATEGHALQVVVEERIRELLRFRAWYRANPYTVSWPTRYENDAELRALVRLARRARDVAANAYPDPITQAKGWTESERREAWGR
jgi:hypothetical protein